MLQIPAVPGKCGDFVLKKLFMCACIQNIMKIFILVSWVWAKRLKKNHKTLSETCPATNVNTKKHVLYINAFGMGFSLDVSGGVGGICGDFTSRVSLQGGFYPGLARPKVKVPASPWTRVGAVVTIDWCISNNVFKPLRFK